MSETTVDKDPVEKLPEQDREALYPSSAYAWYCVLILMGIYLNSFLDRQILGLLVGPIRADMQISDTQMGFLMGPSFAIFYIVAGLPLGWLVDRMSRKVLVAIGQFFWSLASISFGLGRTYAQLLGARVAVGVGEASLSPSAYSIISDLFPPKRLALALSVYGMGIYIGGGMANLAGGYVLDFTGTGAVYDLPFVGERKSWQLVFFLIALPTIPLTALLLSMREPIRRGVGKIVGRDGTMQAAKVPVAEFFRYLRSNAKTVLSHNVGFAWLSFAGYGAAAWAPTLFIRVHGYEAPFTGKALGLMAILIGPPGLFFAGWLADRLRQRGYRDARIRVGLIAAVGSLPLAIAYPWVPNGTLALTLYAVSQFFAAMPWGVAPAAIQEMMPNQMRGQASAVYLFIVNLLGLALGPYILAIFTDYVFKDDMMINYSLLLAGLMAHVFAITLLIVCRRHYVTSLDRLRDWSPEGVV